MNSWRHLDSTTRRDLHEPLLCPRRIREDLSAFEGWFASARPARQVPTFTRNAFVLPSPKLPSTVADLDLYPEWRFNHRFSCDERNHFLCVYAKLKRDDLWHLIEWVYWAGPCAVLLFYPKTGEAFVREYLQVHGFGDHWMADHDKSWGLRSDDAGCQLHFGSASEGMLSVHIDLHNPGIRTGPIDAADHMYQDLMKRTKTHTLKDLRRALIRQNILRMAEVP